MSISKFQVSKFGGSSQASSDAVARVVDIVTHASARGPLAVVVSAAGRTTDLLIEAVSLASSGQEARAVEIVRELEALTRQQIEDLLGPGGAPERTPVTDLFDNLEKLLYGVGLLREYTPQSLDLIQSFGERLSASLLADFLQSRGVPSLFVDAREWLVTDATFGAAVVDWAQTAARISELRVRDDWASRVTVHTGFLGRTPDGRTTTLGRNGSDYSATLLARGLEAEEVTIWTGVSGVMTADPEIVHDAYPLPRMSYMEALELATFGARMFHPRTMIPLMESGIPLRIRSTFDPEAEGTRVDESGQPDADRPTSVTSLERLALIDIQVRRLDAKARVSERVQRALDAAGLPVWLGTQSAHGQALSAVVPGASAERARAAVQAELRAEIDAHDINPVGVAQPVTLLTLVAEAMGQSVNVAGRMFAALGAVGVNVMSIGQSASSRSISCVVPATETQTAVRAVHDAFNFSHQTISLCVLGKGTVGSELLQQIASQREKLRRDHDISIQLVALADQKRIAFDLRGIEPSHWEAKLDAAPDAERGAHGPVTSKVLDELRRMPVPVLVDVTAADDLQGLYHEAFRRGVHVVAANKKPLTIPLPERDALLSSARAHHRFYAYETTVGASLPVIETLKDLVRTGDRVNLIEGSFSGTLGYLTDEMMKGTPLHQAVRTAKELGYTEPQPQDDLSGLDAARKALILARELGMRVELSDVALTPLVPQEILEESDLERFFERLAAHQPVLDEQLEAMKARGETLRYLARIDPDADEGAVLKVGPTNVPANHPATRLRSSESFVAFTTERYAEFPLIVQGAGAGGAVTAAGVLADVLRIAQTLRGR